eukprot:TRINITY_DN12231_c0_g1_i1.p1 TRINITY_DN12231_c0_g1~~TRINITY_DN12231_c0_g1_i1.p1  ORF type:complete len:312 (-),score=58.67 TRINITY_DN12231_c0_g1_i1:761-1696(-)
MALRWCLLAAACCACVLAAAADTEQLKWGVAVTSSVSASQDVVYQLPKGTYGERIHITATDVSGGDLEILVNPNVPANVSYRGPLPRWFCGTRYDNSRSTGCEMLLDLCDSQVSPLYVSAHIRIGSQKSTATYTLLCELVVDATPTTLHVSTKPMYANGTVVMWQEQLQIDTATTTNVQFYKYDQIFFKLPTTSSEIPRSYHMEFQLTQVAPDPVTMYISYEPNIIPTQLAGPTPCYYNTYHCRSFLSQDDGNVPYPDYCTVYVNAQFLEIGATWVAGVWEFGPDYFPAAQNWQSTYQIAAALVPDNVYPL